MSRVLDDFRWLVSPPAADLLSAMGGTAGLPTRVPELSSSSPSAIFAPLSPERKRLIREQIELRRRAANKFPDAQRMFFTARGLEQASSLPVARYKAARFADLAPLADLACGIGGDLVALAEVGPVVGIERDEVAGVLAQANGRALGLSNVSIRVARVEDVDPADFAAWHCDPDRRPGGRRTTAPEGGEPSLDELDRWRTLLPHAAIKLAPAAILPETWQEECEREWIGHERECKQQVVWSGRLSRGPGVRSFAVLPHAGRPLRTFFASPAQITTADESLPLAQQIDAYVFEPHAAVLAARLDRCLAAELNLAAVSAQAAYYTGPAALGDAALAEFAVEEVLPFDRKRLKAHLRARGIGRVEVKKRGVQGDPAEIARQLAVPGDQSAVLILTPFQNRVLALICRRRGEESGSTGGNIRPE